MHGGIRNIDNTAASNSKETQSKFIISNLREFHKQDSESPYSVKIVTEGTERYKINGQPFKLEAGNYLIVNKSDELEVNIESRNDVKGICIYPPEALIKEVFNYHTKSNNKLLDSPNLCTDTDHFTRKNHRLEATKSGSFLSAKIPSLMQQNMKGHNVDFNDFYTQLAEHLVQDQLLINQQLTNIHSTKRQTQEELFRRVSLAREYIQYNFTQKISIEELAAISSLSKYHFLRVFKELFRCTPYQLILKLKLNTAEKLINKGYSYSQASDEVGFSDPKNLRKALKKFGN